MNRQKEEKKEQNEVTVSDKGVRREGKELGRWRKKDEIKVQWVEWSQTKHTKEENKEQK